MAIERAAILRAREVIADRLHRTPTLSCRSLGDRVSLKAELLQRTGSFKPRGMLNALAALSPEARSRGIVTWSAGNAAQGAAFAAAQAGVACRVFMWRTASPAKVEATRAYGAEVDLEAEGPLEAHERLLEHVARTGATFVHPFDDPTLQAGHGTLALEIAEDVPDVRTVVVPAGGGGLLAGVASALDCRVVGVEPEGAPTLTAALAAGRPVAIEPRTIADGLGAPMTGAATLAIVQERVDEVVLVSDEEIAEGLRFLYARAKLACEPAGAAAVAAILAGKIDARAGAPLVAIVSGGNADPRVVAGILAGR
ncbi:MAG: pyridoxal-phosphate dependent enzyme [Thermoleophilia bacterium]|nr:pyridoxal-phosphate dependent enzyme [Gaiellaceae bacterium]MDW8338806.1 pyridoxal-phosphate dependent enzyme [Thermoleophilia bacterium]